MNFSLFTLSQNKTNCRPSHDCELGRHTRKMSRPRNDLCVFSGTLNPTHFTSWKMSPHSTTLWNAELVCLMEGILFPSKRWWLWKRELRSMVLVAMERADCVMWQLECQASNVTATRPICSTWAWGHHWVFGGLTVLAPALGGVGPKFALLHWLWSSPLQHSRTTVRVCDTYTLCLIGEVTGYDGRALINVCQCDLAYQKSVVHGKVFSAVLSLH